MSFQLLPGQAVMEGAAPTRQRLPGNGPSPGPQGRGTTVTSPWVPPQSLLLPFNLSTCSNSAFGNLLLITPLERAGHFVLGS